MQGSVVERCCDDDICYDYDKGRLFHVEQPVIGMEIRHPIHPSPYLING